MPGSTLRKIRGDSHAPPDAAHPVVPPADSDDLITLVKLVLSSPSGVGRLSRIGRIRDGSVLRQR